MSGVSCSGSPCAACFLPWLTSHSRAGPVKARVAQLDALLSEWTAARASAGSSHFDMYVYAPPATSRPASEVSALLRERVRLLLTLARLTGARLPDAGHDLVRLGLELGSSFEGSFGKSHNYVPTCLPSLSPPNDLREPPILYVSLSPVSPFRNDLAEHVRLKSNAPRCRCRCLLVEPMRLVSRHTLRFPALHGARKQDRVRL